MGDYEQFSLDEEGGLAISGVSVKKMAQKYGTPLYLMDEETIRINCRRYMEVMRRNFGENFAVAYASKAFCAKAIYPILAQEGLHADVVSAGELYTALSGGFLAEHLHFHGNNKTEEEIRLAVENGVYSFIADSMEELDVLQTVADKYQKTLRIALRIKPGVDAHTHEFIQTGKIDSKFGFAYETGEALEAIKKVDSCKDLKLYGIHCHIGSQIFLTEPYLCAVRVMMKFMDEIRTAVGYPPQELNLGGGFGVALEKADRPTPPEEIIDSIGACIREEAKKYDLPLPFITIEPGRSIVGPAGITVYTVGNVKQIPDTRTYVAIDGGMTDNPRYALYGASYELTRVSGANEPRSEKITLAGKCCESGDLITKDSMLQPVSKGDLVAVFATGAYNYSMVSNYNKLRRPPVVFVRRGEDRPVVRRESFDQLIQNDL